MSFHVISTQYAASSREDLIKLRCHEKRRDPVKTAAMAYDTRAEAFSLCHPKDAACRKMQSRRFDSEMFATVPILFFGDGRTVISIQTDCVDFPEYYILSLYWAGETPVLQFLIAGTLFFYKNQVFETEAGRS